ncbi:unnamed protein product [Notodromas monacha]|uniref:Uncharacterized protein n=1 Tax=Notodromas monacha TaxID=399045 RepID=A0A7R9GCB5_9CRUS|nr:unnamed protein product [Notodromas monacha]CAG0915656.1 unnamed protein product [Notodromas monacha]
MRLIDLSLVSDDQLAKQRASVTWLLRKAFKNKVPEELVDPYYRDHKDQEWLKPQVVRDLANATYYCMTLANIYSSPSFTQLNHWGVIQALNRKGVYVGEPGDVALTETVLIQTTPIKMSAHMAMIEALMSLFVKELTAGGRVMTAVRRVHAESEPSSSEKRPSAEEALLTWVNASCAKLAAEIEARLTRDDRDHAGDYDSIEPSDSLAVAALIEDGWFSSNVDGALIHTKVPEFPVACEVDDLRDGSALGGVIGLYCPDDADWSEVRCPTPASSLSQTESLKNLRILAHVCNESLTHNPLCFRVEDLVNMNWFVTVEKHLKRPQKEDVEYM